jgi:crossover junction endodeoxyribonuclease RuvC
MKIISIDPGYERLGVAILEKNTGDKKEILVHSECVTTSADLPYYERLLIIGKAVASLIDRFEPTAVAIETLFFTKNQKTAMAVAEARGVVLYEAIARGLKVYEYTPNQIKGAVTGFGNADKKHIISMLPKLITISKAIQHDDEFDAIAVGLTCFASERLLKKA